MKNKINIDWDCDDAEGKNYCLYSESNNSCRFYKTKPIINSEGLWNHNINYFGAPLVDKWALHERPKEKQMDSIYTQEMHDAGELPRVGMRCNVFSLEQQKEVEAVILSIFDSKRGKGCVCESDLAGLHVYELARVLPIKEKTDKEKAIDDINKIYKDKSCYKTATEFLMRAIQEGKIHGVTFTENKNVRLVKR